MAKPYPTGAVGYDAVIAKGAAMKADNFDLHNYLERIGYAGTPAPNLATVAEFMRRQLYSIPFENLDVRAGKTISLVPEDIVDKIVGRRRGGYCYEVNGLFAMALEALGVPYRFIGCRPMTLAARRPRTHMAVLARLDGEDWLCDVGFGSYGMRAPMRLADTDQAIHQGDDAFMLAAPDPHEYRFQARVDGAWTDQYGFDLSHQEWVDFMPANWLNSTYPEALFVKNLVVMRQTPEGRLILFNNRLKTITHGHATVRPVEADALPDLLRDLFGLHATA